MTTPPQSEHFVPSSNAWVPGRADAGSPDLADRRCRRPDLRAGADADGRRRHLRPRPHRNLFPRRARSGRRCCAPTAPSSRSGSAISGQTAHTAIYRPGATPAQAGSLDGRTRFPQYRRRRRFVGGPAAERQRPRRRRDRRRCTNSTAPPCAGPRPGRPMPMAACRSSCCRLPSGEVLVLTPSSTTSRASTCRSARRRRAGRRRSARCRRRSPAATPTRSPERSSTASARRPPTATS